MLSDSQITDTLFQSVTNDDAYAELTLQLAAITGSVSAQIQTHTIQGARTESIYGLDKTIIEKYNEHYWDRDVWVAGYQNTALHVVAVSDEFVNAADFTKSEIYNDLLRPNGDFFRCMGFVTPLEHSGKFMFAVHRVRTQPEFEPDLVRKMQSFQPLITHLVSARRRLEMGHGPMALQLLDDDRDAIFLVTGSSAVQYANGLAKKLVAQRELFRLAGNVLTVTVDGDAPNLARAIKWACSGRGGSLLEVAYGGQRLGISIDSLGGRFSSFACVRIHDHEFDLTLLLERARRKFGFTEAEMSLARSIISGSSVAQHAAMRGVSITTVRTQLRCLFDKTSVTRQAAFVALMTAL